MCTLYTGESLLCHYVRVSGYVAASMGLAKSIYLNKLLLERNNRLTEDDNIDVFKIIETFIEKSKRF